MLQPNYSRNKMWTVVLILCLSVYGSCTDVPVIEMKLTDDNNGCASCDALVSSKLFWNESFTLRVQSDFPINNGSCDANIGTKDIKLVPNFRMYNNFYVPEQEVRRYNVYNVTCAFTVHCQGKTSKVQCPTIENRVNLKLGYAVMNDAMRNMTIASGDDSLYDVYDFYRFYEGELAKISFHKSYNKHKIGYMKLSTTNVKANHTTATRLQITTRIEKLLKLTADYDGGYIDCTIYEFDKNTQLVIRIFLILMMESASLGFEVNGMALRPSQSMIYEYYDGENVTVRTVTKKNYEDMVCHGENIPDDFPGYKNGTEWTACSMHFQYIIQEKHKNITISCSAKNKINGIKENVSLHLIPNTFDYDPFIKGLSKANILEKSNTRVSTLMRYEYDVMDLNLSCYAHTAGPKWEFNPSEVTNNNSSVSFRVDINYYELLGAFELKNEINQANINCTYPHGNITKVTTIELIRKMKYLPPNGALYDTRNTETTVTPTPSPTTPGGPITDMKIIIGSCIFIVVVVIAVMLLMIIPIVKQKQKPSAQNPNPTATPYETLPVHNGAQTPIPRPHEEAQYAAPSDMVQENHYMTPYVPETVDEMYSKITPKNQRNVMQENPRTLPLGTPAWNNILPQSIRSGINYVRVLPNIVKGNTLLPNGRNNNAKNVHKESPYAEVIHNESPYAEVTRNESPYAEVTRNESPYAEIIRSERPYAEVISPNPYAEPNLVSHQPANAYVNVFNDPRYVNSEANEKYVEPAYCEVGTVKK